MKNSIKLEATKRNCFGTSTSRKLRIGKKIPAIIYGNKKINESISVDENQISKIFKVRNIQSLFINIGIDGKYQTVIIKETQRHPYKNKILHIDFQRVEENSIISTKIPIIFLNKKNCPGVKNGGKLNIKMVDANIICKAKHLPESIEVDLSNLHMNQHLDLNDIKGDKNITFLEEKRGFNRIVVSIKKSKKAVGDKSESNDNTPNKLANESKL